MELRIGEILLRTVTESDAEEVARMWEYPNIITREKACQAIAGMERARRKNRPKAICHLCLAIFHREAPKRIIGWCGLDGEAEPGKTVLFYSVDAEFRNRGYATRCVRELLRYAFEEMDYETIYGGCSRENHASYRVMQKAGMSQTAFYDNGDPIFSMDRGSFRSP